MERIEFTSKAKEDLAYWKKINNVAVLKRIRILLEAILQNPFEGIGKPEQLKHSLAGHWSRRINQEHRIVYVIIDSIVYVKSLQGHY